MPELGSLLADASALTYTRLRAAPEGDGWRPFEEFIAAPDEVSATIADLKDISELDRDDVAGQQLIEAWAWGLAANAAVAVLKGGVLPDLRGANVLVRGRPGVQGTEAALARPVAVNGASEGDLLAQLAATLAGEHLEPLVDAVNAETGRPARALWRGASDRLAGAVLWVAEQLDRPADAEALARCALAAPGPLAAQLQVDQIPLGNGRFEPVHIRSGCCIWYRGPTELKCLGCPLVEAEERQRRTLEWVRERDGY